jgi:hypothetical protein
MLVYLALSSFLVGFYSLWDGRYWVALVLLAAGLAALAGHLSRKNDDDTVTPRR